MQREQLAAALPGAEVVLAPGLAAGKRRAQLVSVLSRRSWEFGRYRRPMFAAELLRLVRERRPAIVHFDDLGVAAFAPVPGALTVFAPHNVEHRILRGNAGAAAGARRAFGELEWRKVRREEQRAWWAADLSVAVSDLDAGSLRAGGARSVAVCPNGTDRVAALALPHRQPDEPLRLLFIGSGDYRPYEVGLAWFLDKVYPEVARAVPVSFQVVGQPPRRPRQAPGVSYLGRVPSVLPHYERAHVLVVPVFEGSGTRLKVVEAMALGRPVLSTRLGAEGLGIEPGAHYLAADDPVGFARELIALARGMERPGQLAPMLARARTAAEPLFWDVIVEDLVALYRVHLERKRGDALERLAPVPPAA